MDWAMDGKASAYSYVDTKGIASSGQSCGGLEALATAYRDPRVKRILMFNISIFQDEKRYLLEKIEVLMGYFIGVSGDLGYLGV